MPLKTVFYNWLIISTFEEMLCSKPDNNPFGFEHEGHNKTGGNTEDID